MMSLTVLSTCCILATIAVLAVADLPQARRPLTARPLNDAVPLGGVVTLVCEVDTAPPLTRVLWYEYVTASTRQLVSDNGIISPGHPNAERYSIVQPDRETQFHLRISSIGFADGGTYECTDANSGPPTDYIGRAQLIVIDPATNCTTTVPSNGIVREGQNLTNECIINYRGGIAPTTTWVGPEPFNTLTTVNPDTVFTGIGFSVRRELDTRNFQLHINFTELELAPDGTATNAPDYNRIDAFQQLFVYWAPINLYYEPVQTQYEVGDILTCYADARPAPVYQWQNLNDLSITTSQLFIITSSMVGMNTTMRCGAQNIIQGLVYSGNIFLYIYVPPPTTIPPSTTVPSTTTPPLDGPCVNLTGWWLSTSPYAELYLNVTPEGRVVGGMRNFTDQYTVEVAGRTRMSDYAYIGLTLIYPFNKGLLGLTGECHRCSGVETIFVETILRSITDSAGCGDGGNPGPSTAFVFNRWDGGLTPGN